MTTNNGVAQRYDADNQIVAAGPITYSFDGDGNQTATSASALPAWRYDAQNHTISYGDSASPATYQTNGGRQRGQASVTAGGVTTTGTHDYDISGLASFRQTAPSARTLSYVRDPGGRLLALTDGVTVYYYGLEGRGRVASLTDKSGAMVKWYCYGS